MNKNITVVAVLVAAVAFLGGIWLTKSNAPAPVILPQVPSDVVNRLTDAIAILQEGINKPVGADAGPDSTNPFFSVNGVRWWPTRVGVFGPNNETATNTICRIVGPPATSTLVGFTLRSNASSTAFGFEAYLGPFGSGTGTEAVPEMGMITLASSSVNNDFGFSWGTATVTPTNLPTRRATQNFIVPPSAPTASGAQYGLDVRMLGNQTTAGWKLDGRTCSAVWQEL